MTQQKSNIDDIVQNFELKEKIENSEPLLIQWIRTLIRKPSEKQILVEKARHQIEKELDLLKFVKRSRLMLTSTIATVTPYQMKFMNKVSQLVVKLSSSSS